MYIFRIEKFNFAEGSLVTLIFPIVSQNRILALINKAYKMSPEISLNILEEAKNGKTQVGSSDETKIRKCSTVMNFHP